MIVKCLAYRKTLVLLLLTSVLLFSATGCDMIIINDVSMNNLSNGDVEKNNDPNAFVPTKYTPYVNDEDHKAVSDRYLEELPKRDFDGAVFFLTTPTTAYIDPDASGNNVSRMAWERNRAIEEKYNITIISSVRNADTMLTELENAVASDSYYTDLMMTPLYMTGQYRMAKVLLNLRSMPFLNLDAPYFNQESIAMTSAGYQTYGVAGHASISPDDFSAVFFNRDLMENAGLALPYGAVMDENWTWDVFFDYTASAADLNGDNGTPLISVAVQKNASRLADLIFISCGNQYIKSERRSEPKIAFSATDAAYAVKTAYQILTDPNAAVDASADLISDFANGKALFLIEYLSTMTTLSDSSANWGILPLPTEAQGTTSRTLLANTELIFTVPSNHTNPEIAAIVLSALNAGSYCYLYDEYVNYSMVYLLRDNDSVNMLDLILDTAAFDFALAFGNAYSDVSDGTYNLIRKAAQNNNLTDLYPAAESAVKDALTRDFNLD